MRESEEFDGDTTDGPLLFGRVLDGRGGARAITWEEARRWVPQTPNEMLWVHLWRTQPGVVEWLKGLGISAPTAGFLTSDDTRPRAFHEDNALVATLRAINVNPGADPEDMVSMQLWCDGTRLVTLRRNRLQAPRETVSAIDHGHGPKDAGAVITLLVKHITAGMGHSIVDLNQQIDELEAGHPDKDTSELLDRIVTIRRSSLALKRHMSPQHEALEQIARDAPEWFEDHDRREAAETIHRMRRYLDDLDISKESVVVMQDDLRARAIASTNRTSYLLTIVASIFLPLTFLTGLLGINVAGIPGAEHPTAFWIVVGLCGAIMLAQLALFWRWKWF